MHIVMKASEPTTWYSSFFKSRTVSLVIGKNPKFYGSEISFVCLQIPAIMPSSQPVHSTPTFTHFFIKIHFNIILLFMSTSPVCPLYWAFPDWCCTYILISFCMLFSAHLTTFNLLSQQYQMKNACCIPNVHIFFVLLPSCEGTRPVIAQPLSLQVATLPVCKTYNDFERGN
jgi:hypothetical protein